MIALFRQLILSITAAALFGAVVLALTDQKSQRGLLHLAVGILLLLAIINPLRIIQLPEFLQLPDSMTNNWNQSENTDSAYVRAVRETFCMQTEEYLEAKIEEKGLSGDIQLEVSEDNVLTISTVHVVCDNAYSAGRKEQLEEIIQSELGIGKEVITIREEENKE